MNSYSDVIQVLYVIRFIKPVTSVLSGDRLIH